MSSMAIEASSNVANDGDERLRATVRRHGQPARVLVEGHVVAAVDEQLTCPRDHRLVTDNDFDSLAADLCLELVGGTARDDLAVIDDGDRIGQLVGLLEVLRRQQERRPFPDERPDDVPHAEPAARVEPGGRLVEDQESWPADQGTPQVEPTPHSA